MSFYPSDELPGGVQRKKPTHMLFQVRLEDFQSAVDWLRAYIFRYSGHVVTEVALVPDVEQWHFQVEEGFAVPIPHDTVQRLENTLTEIRLQEKARAFRESEAARVDARDASRDGETLGGGHA